MIRSTTMMPALLVPANDFTAQWRAIRDEALAAIDRVGERGWLVLGSEVKAFEEELAAWHGLPASVGTGNGLDALEIALRCHGVGPGDVVLTTPLTAFATTLAILRVGARPAFVDVDSAGLLDLDLVESALRSGTAAIKAVVPVHLFGHAMDVPRLRDLAQRYRVAMIEDCAQAIGARFDGQPVGSASRASATSFYPTKNLGCLGDGGAVFVADEETRARAATLRDYGQTAKYVHDIPGLNSRLDEVQAAVLRSALLPRLSAFTARRRQIAETYRAQIRHPAVRVPPVPAKSESVWHLFPVQLQVAARRDDFQAHLRNHGVASGVHYPVLTSSQRAAGHDVQRLTPLPRAEEFAQTEVSLPIHPFLDEEGVARVVAAVNTFEQR